MGVFGDGEEKQRKRNAARKPSAMGTGYDAAFRGYINLNLTAEQKAGFEAWAESGSLWEALEGFTGDGVHISVKWDAKAECFLASGTQRREASPNAGLVVTARAASAGVAFGRLLYSLTALAHAERWEDVQPLADPNRW